MSQTLELPSFENLSIRIGFVLAGESEIVIAEPNTVCYLLFEKMARGGRLTGASRNELSMVQLDTDRDALLHSCDARYSKVIRQKKFGVVKT